MTASPSLPVHPSRRRPRVASLALAGVLLVAGVSTAAAPAGHYNTNTQPGQLLDLKTSLAWQLDQQGPMSHIQAIAACSGLKLNGNTWRLPTVGELQTLVDYGQGTGAAIDPHFINTTAGCYWSATAQAGLSTNHWYVSFDPAATQSTLYSADSNSCSVRCVQ